jgi:ribosome-binding protein aMBF1 (putative translation factor)
MSDAPLTPEQVKTARQLLGWSRIKLAARVNASEGAIRRYENDRGIADRLNLMTVREILEAAGVIFVEENGEGPGVRLRKGSVQPSDGEGGAHREPRGERAG